MKVFKTINATMLGLLMASTLSNASIADKVAKEAIKLDGYSYIYGAKGKNNKIDCSGLTYLAFKNAGITVNKNIPMSVKMYSKSKEFKAVSLNNIKRGDIILWKMNDNRNEPNHITLYLGKNKHISSENEPMDVIIVPCFTKKDLC